MCHDKRPSEWLRKNVTTLILLSQHKGLNIEEELCRDNIFSCRDTDYCNLEKPVETLYEEVMSRQGDECRDTERQGFWS